MRRYLLGASALVALLAAVAVSTAATAKSPGAVWAAAVQTAPGRVVLPMLPEEMGSATLALPNGDLLVAGGSGSGALEVTRLLPSGLPDPGFGDDGVSRTSVTMQEWALFAQPNGDLLVLGHIPTAAEERQVVPFDWMLVRLLPDGSVDSSFGNSGVLDATAAHAAQPTIGVPNAAMTPDGGLLLAVNLGGIDFATQVAGLERLRADGSPDPSFGTGGVVRLPGSDTGPFAVQPDGSIVVDVGTTSATQSFLMKLTPTGAPDPSFAGGAPVSVGAEIYALMVDADGRTVALAKVSTGLFGYELLRFTSQGAPDPAWGTAGATDLTALEVVTGWLFPTEQGGALLVGFSRLLTLGAPPASDGSTLIARFTAGGALDSTLGGATGLLLDNSGGTFGWIERADGSFVGRSAVSIAGNHPDAPVINGALLTALDATSYTPDASFGAPSSLRVSIRVKTLNARGIVVSAHASGAAAGTMRVTGAGRVFVGHAPADFLCSTGSCTPETAQTTILLNPVFNKANRKYLQRHPHQRLAIKLTVTDLAGNTATATASAPPSKRS